MYNVFFIIKKNVMHEIRVFFFLKLIFFFFFLKINFCCFFFKQKIFNIFKKMVDTYV